MVDPDKENAGQPDESVVVPQEQRITRQEWVFSPNVHRWFAFKRNDEEHKVYTPGPTSTSWFPPHTTEWMPLRLSVVYKRVGDEIRGTVYFSARLANILALHYVYVRTRLDWHSGPFEREVTRYMIQRNWASR